MPDRTTKAHLANLIRDVQGEIKEHLLAGRFQASRDLTAVLAELAHELGAGMYVGAER